MSGRKAKADRKAAQAARAVGQAQFVEQLKEMRDSFGDSLLSRGYQYSSPVDLVLHEGRFFEHRRLDRWFAPEAAPTVRYGQPRKCITNALSACAEHRDLRYVEGFAWHRKVPLPLHHAWNIDRDDRVVDFTWDERLWPADRRLYLGIVFETEAALQAAEEHGSSILSRDEAGRS
jgi:hypothetical protein